MNRLPFANNNLNQKGKKTSVMIGLTDFQARYKPQMNPAKYEVERYMRKAG
jgi:hypothetical protein